VIKGLSKRPLIFSLANNHIGDHSEQGIKDTIAACEKNDILYGGVSRGNEYKPVFLNTSEGNIGIIFVSDKEFGISLDNRLGVDYLTPRLYSKITEVRKQCDILVLSIHSASEWNCWPSPTWQDAMHSFIDCGADFVYGHHSHVPQGWEQYKSGWIVYGLGNFVIPTQRFQSKMNSLWSLCADVEIKDKRIQSVRMTPLDIIVKDNDSSIEIVKSNWYNHEGYMERINAPLSNCQLLTGLWQSFAFIRFENMLSSFQMTAPDKQIQLVPQSKLNRIRHIWHILRNRYDKAFSDTVRYSTPSKELGKESSECRAMYNWYACMPHKDVMETALSVLAGQQDDYRTTQTDEMVKRYVFDNVDMNVSGGILNNK
ncbi:MAG: CapA family protein, partial [Thermoguttaceae bacterium]|nr:CapA family protein [Thermoguttaceae bacterium]